MQQALLDLLYLLKIRGYEKPSSSGKVVEYEGWDFNSGNYLFTTDTK